MHSQILVILFLKDPRPGLKLHFCLADRHGYITVGGSGIGQPVVSVCHTINCLDGVFAFRQVFAKGDIGIILVGVARKEVLAVGKHFPQTVLVIESKANLNGGVLTQVALYLATDGNSWESLTCGLAG